MPNTNRMLPAALAAALVVAPGFAFAQTARDGTPSNPPSDAVGRTVDRATGQPTRPDGTPGNPPSTAVGRTVDRVTGQPTNPDGTGNNPPGTAVGRALERAGTAVSDAARSVTPNSAPATTATREVRPSNRASKIIGANIYNEDGQSIGEVEDLIVQRDGGAPVAVVSVGGFLGIGARLVAVPLNELRFAETDSRWTLAGATKESLQARPVVSYAARG
ncbi:PRC-barrel domain-containing protein [Roseomonas sp. HJA6]|uniref:PRC-barrel domain-containing protein n=1 Tax=Roseomonas alba TaxID=2846776 RepID=A0ABS7ADD2_9PROT|nr:PRC-barrel domain-containing protein [Neoroseomonas alba]MBW6400302.1 PRC-barrel domain-containing protein [Neoroseomonas alba]